MLTTFRSLFAPLRKRRTQPRCQGLAIEHLEMRQLLAADLMVVNENLVSVERSGPTDVQVFAEFSILNAGDIGLVAGNVHLEGVLSADQVFGNADDVLVDLDLMDLNLIPGTIANGSISGTPDLSDYLSSNYLLIKIDPDDAINEDFEANNVAVISLPNLPTFDTSAGQTIGKTNRVIRVDPGISFTDSDADSLTGGSLIVSVDNDDGDNNILSIKRINTESGILRRKQNELRLGKSVIGTIAGGTSTDPLVITFTGDVGNGEVQSIASAVSLKGKKGVTGVRNVQFYVTEPTIVTGFIATKQVSLT